MSDHSEIDSSANSSGSEESIDLSDSNSEASETILYNFQPSETDSDTILLLNTQLSQMTRKTDFQICPGYLHVHK